MRAYVAVRWYTDGECPDIRLYEDINFAVEFLLYPWTEDSGYTERDLDVFRECLRNFKTVEFGNHECCHILNLTTEVV
jgi:hypothetical protein